MGTVAYKTVCPRCKRNGRDNSQDNLVVYTNESAHCFACGFTVRSEDEAEEDNFNETMADFTKEDNDRLKAYTTLEGKGYRGITDTTYKYFGVRHEYDSNDILIKQYYPITSKSNLCGYKVRKIPKEFHCMGTVGKTNDLFGQHRFKNSTGKYCLVVGGEIDQLSAYQMLKDYQIAKGSDDYAEIPVVSPTVGETGCHKQLQEHYEWFNRFDRVIVCFDNDEAGRKATDMASKVLPKGKMFVMDLNMKDTNEYLKAGRQKEWIGLFFKARKYSPAGIIGSDTLYEKVIEHARMEKIPFPPFMSAISEMTAGGIPLGRIVNIGAGSGIGKTTLVNEMIYHWIFHSPHLIGVVSLELDSGEYGEVILSRHLHKKIGLIADPEDKVQYLLSEDVRKAADYLYKKPDGSPRWLLMDDRDGTIESIKQTVEELIVACDCKVIVLDPLQDILDGMSNEEQSLFMKWQKQLVKSHKVAFININHVRKSGAGSEANSAGAFITEEDFSGSSSIFKSAAANFLFTRNKYSENPIERNTVKCTASKIRWTGRTGPAGELFYDNDSHTFWNKEIWMEKIGIIS